jgi:cytochrome c oxidase subunit 2
MNPDARTHHVLDAMGPQAGHIVDLWRIFLVICSVVFGAILAVLLLVLWRRRARRRHRARPVARSTGPSRGAPQRHRRAWASHGAAGAAGRRQRVHRPRARALSLKDAVTLEVTAHQWWWTVKYVNGGPSETFETANEIHVPVGRPVVVKLKSDDVIHSLWVPNLAGKRDLIPGRTALIQFQADQPGVYRGQCAEFCGFQHALHGLRGAWPSRRRSSRPGCRRSASPPRSRPMPQAQRGKRCSSPRQLRHVPHGAGHAGAGQAGAGPHAPRQSRQTLAAGTLPNTPQNLASWIADPQKHKPGTNMPATPMSKDDLQAIVAYLGTLK